MLRKLLAVAATCGLLVSLSVLVPERTRANAAQEKVRALSASEMKGTKGAFGSTCSRGACYDQGCRSAAGIKSYFYVSTPRTVCEPHWAPWVTSVCNNFTNGHCSTTDEFTGSSCVNYVGTTISFIDYCGTWP